MRMFTEVGRRVHLHWTAISLSGPAARLTLKSATKVTPLLKRVARGIASEFDNEAAV